MLERIIDRRYRLLRTLGRGGFGEVFLAEDLDEGGTVALKLIDRASSDFAQLKRRLQREARATQSLDAQRVARVLRVGESDDGQLYVVMPFVEGHTIRALLRSEGMVRDDVLRWIEELSVTLGEAHEVGLVHRDVKPDNVMVTPEGRVVLLDFGIVKAVTDESDGAVFASTQLTRSGATVGTVAYAAPEQALGQAVDGRADQFALAVMAYELLTGRLPWKGDVPARVLAQLLYEDVPPPSTHRPSLSLAVDATLRRALAKRPEDRFASVREFSEALKSAVQHGTVPSALAVSSLSGARPVSVTAERDEPEGSALARPRSRRRRAVLGGAAALVLLAGAFTTLTSLRAPATGWHGGARGAVAISAAAGDTAKACPAWLVGAISEGLTSQLAAGGRLRTIGPRELGPLETTPSKEAAGPWRRSLRGAFGADAVLEAVCEEAHGDVAEVHVAAVSTDEPGKELTAFRVSGSSTAPSELVARIAERARRELGVAAPDADELRRAGRTLPASAGVARDYIDGISRLGVYDGAGAHELLQKVVAAEPDFAPGHAALAAACAYLGEQRDAAKEGALAAAGAESLPNEERLLVTADAAAARYAWDEALETYRAIVRVFPDRRDVAFKLIRAALDAGRPKDAQAALDEVMSRGGEPADPRVPLSEAWIAHLAGDSDRAAEAGKRAADMADAAGLPAVKAQALLNTCTSLTHVSRSEGPDPCVAAQELFDKLGDRIGVIRSEGLRVYVLVQRGDYERARPLAEHSVDLAAALGSPDARAAALMETVLIAMGQGDVGVWKSAGRDTVELADLGGNASTQVRARTNFAAALVDNGDLEEGRKLYEEGLVLARQAGMKSSAAIILQNLVNYFIAKGEIGRARDGATEALGMLAPGSFDRAWALDALGNAEVESDSLDRAREHYQEALDLRSRAGVSTASSRQNLGEVLLDAGNVDGALRESTASFDDFSEAGVDVGAMQAGVVVARVHLARGEIKDAMAVIDRGFALAKESQSSPDLFVPVRMRAFVLEGKPDAALAAGDPLPAHVPAQRYTRLIRDQIWLRRGMREEARADLDALEKEAHAAGHARVEHFAQDILAGKDVSVL